MLATPAAPAKKEAVKEVAPKEAAALSLTDVFAQKQAAIVALLAQIELAKAALAAAKLAAIESVVAEKTAALAALQLALAGAVAPAEKPAAAAVKSAPAKKP